MKQHGSASVGRRGKGQALGLAATAGAVLSVLSGQAHSASGMVLGGVTAACAPQPAETWESALPAFLKTRLRPAFPDAEARERAYVPLREVVSRRAVVYAPRWTELAPEVQLASLQMYARGRMLLLSGRASDALSLLREATALDPEASAPWRELGEAYLSLGRRAEGLECLERAVERGASEERTLLMLAGELIASGQHDRAIGHLARIVSDSFDRPATDLERLALANLATLAGQQGYALAEVEAFERALVEGTGPVGRVAYARELVELHQRTPGLWIQTGDQAMRLGFFERAADAYDHARRAHGGEFVADRQMAALLAAGDAISARQLLVEEVADPARALDERLIGLARLVSKLPGDDLSPAIAMVEPPAGAASSRAWRMWQWRIAAAASPRGAAILRQLCHDEPRDRDPVLDLFAMLPSSDTTGIVHEAMEIVRWRPMAAASVGDALRMHMQAMPEMEVELRRVGSFEAMLLVTDLRLAAGDPAGALRAGQGLVAPGQRAISSNDRERHVAQALAMVHACVGVGDFAGAEAAIDRIRLAGGAWALEGEVEALIVMQRYLQASALAASAEEAGTTPPWAGRVLVRIGQLLGDAALVERGLRIGADADAYDAQSYLGLLQMYQPGSTRANPARLQQVGVHIRTALASTTAVRRAIVTEILQRGLNADAEVRAVALVDERPWDEASLAVALRTWEQIEWREAGAIARGLAWIEARLADAPRSVQLRIAKTTLLAAAGRAEEAEQLLERWQQEHERSEYRLEREALIRGFLGDAPRAAAMRLERLEASPRSIRNMLELSASFLGVGRVEEAWKLLDSLPRGMHLAYGQRVELGRALAEAAEALFPQRPPEAVSHWLRLAEWGAEKSILLPVQGHAARVNLLADVSPPDVEAIRRAVAWAIRQHPSEAGRVRYVAVSRLLELERLTDAVGVLEAMAQGDPDPPVRVYGLWVTLAAQAGTDEHVRTLLMALPRGERARVVLNELGARNEDPGDPARASSRLLARVAAILRIQDRDGLADEAYALAMEIDPDDPWLCNDFGYRLLELGERLDDAAVLIEHAYSMLSDRASVVDSLGWLRYHQGRLGDEIGPDGEVLSEGAVTLLRRAVQMAGEGVSAEVLEHLGDALWRAGEPEEAREIWRQALTAAERELDAARSQGTAPGPRRWAEERATSVRARLEAEPPPVTPMMSGW
ncbi:MAG: hypothetical protein KIT24_00905 [Phycisphaeraceae bacterium]|nr:hypothetical protein [Phycisphaeraceae bacterium]